MSERHLAGRHAVITGGSRGIGAAIASSLASAGADITILARDGEAAAWKAADIAKSSGVRAGGMTCDVSNEEIVRDAFATAANERGPITLLVNNAGVATSAKFADTSRETWDRTLAVDLTGAWLCTQVALPHMLDAKWGRIVNVASTAGLRGYKTMTAYCAAKHGLVGLTRALALEVAKDNITVNAVCPGYVDTDIVKDAITNLRERRNISEDEALAMLTRPIPTGRLTTVDEVASAVAWLCSPNANAVTGIALPIAGGEVS